MPDEIDPAHTTGVIVRHMLEVAATLGGRGRERRRRDGADIGAILLFKQT